MTLVEFLGTPEWRYVGLPIAATALTVLITAVSRPRGHKRPVFADIRRSHRTKHPFGRQMVLVDTRRVGGAPGGFDSVCG